MTCRPLSEVLAQIPDVRQARGRRYALHAILTLACAAMLCGYKSYGAIAEWGRHYGPTLLRAVGMTQGTTPCAATLHLIFRRLDWAALEAALGQWADTVLAATPAQPGTLEAVACDGKTLRGSRKRGAPGAHILSALSQRLGVTVGQVAVDDKTNEITAIQTLLQQLVLHGRVFTMDALLTQREVAQTLVDQHADYVMIAKDNQPRLVADITAILATPATLAAPLRTARTVDKGHGRHERRTLRLRALQPGDCDWPGAQQVFRIDRRVVCLKTGEVQTETHYGVTSLAPPVATPRQLLAVIRAHWHIENKSHWVRDVTFAEDASQVRSGAIPHVMSTLRNTVIGLLRHAGVTNIAAAGRHFAARPWEALALLGIFPEN